MENRDMFAESTLQLGPLAINEPVITTWIIMLVLIVSAWLISRFLQIEANPWQAAVEGLITTIEAAIREVAPHHTRILLPFIASLWIFLVIANLAGIMPGVHSPTRDISVTAALAIVVFFSTHWFGIRAQGLKNYLRHYLAPSPILLPFHIISEITRTVALAIRLFGNIMSLELAALLILLVAGFLVPLPILMLHIIEALVQAYIFGMLALIYIAGGLQSQELKHEKLEE